MRLMTRSTKHNLFRDILLGILLITTYGSSIPHLVISLLLLASLTLKRNFDYKISSIYLIPLFIFAISAFNTLVIVTFDANADSTMMLYRMRKFALELFVAYIVLFYCITRGQKHILRVLRCSLVICILIGAIQFIFNAELRPSMLFLEPSSAGYFIGTFLFVSFFYQRRLGSLLLILSLLILRSKGMIISIIATYVFGKFNLFKFFSISVCLIIFAPIIHTYLLEYSGQYFGFVHLITILNEQGFTGFSSSNGIYDTYLTRLSGIFIGLQSALNNPFGIGFGGFHNAYTEQIYSILTVEDMGREVSGIFSAGGMMTPKSNLIELWLSSGLFGLLLFIFCMVSISLGRNMFFRASVICFVFLSIFTELNNIYMYILLLSYLSKGKYFVQNNENR